MAPGGTCTFQQHSRTSTCPVDISDLLLYTPPLMLRDVINVASPHTPPRGDTVVRSADDRVYQAAVYRSSPSLTVGSFNL